MSGILFLTWASKPRLPAIISKACGLRPQPGTTTTRSPPRADADQASVTADSGKIRTRTSTRRSAIIWMYPGNSAMIVSTDADPAPLPLIRIRRLRSSADGTAASAPASAPICT
jgi:hypothetical protein